MNMKIVCLHKKKNESCRRNLILATNLLIVHYNVYLVYSLQYIDWNKCISQHEISIYIHCNNKRSIQLSCTIKYYFYSLYHFSVLFMFSLWYFAHGLKMLVFSIYLYLYLYLFCTLFIFIVNSHLSISLLSQFYLLSKQ